MARFRPCKPEDMPAVQEILRQSPEAAPWSHVALSETLATDPAHFLVAVHEQQISGFIIGCRIADEAEIRNLAVHPQSRRHGLATALVQAFLHTCSCNHVNTVFLEVRESNSAAISFYRRLGFCQTARRPAYYSSPTEDALIFSLRLLAGT